jgi:spore coat polysaccharide biosynthesis protein SpsF (cytidylyltransferase family)
VPAPVYLANKPYRLTVDTESDLSLMEKIFQKFCTATSLLPDLEKVIDFLDTHPDIAKINANTQQKNWRS